MVTPTEAALRVETISSEPGLARLSGSWDELVRAMPRPSPYLLHGWLLEWWRHYGGDDALAVHVAYRGDRLVGALPLCTRNRPGLRVTEFVGGTWAILADVLVAPGENGAVAATLVDRATSMDHDFANLFGLPGSSGLASAAAPDALRLLQRLECPVLELGAGWDEVYRAKFSSKKRSERRRRWRQLEQLGTVEASRARTAEEIDAALDDVFRVYSLRWQGRRDASGFVTPEGMRFHRGALLRLAADDVPRILTIRLDGRAIAFALSLLLAGRAYGVTMAFDPAYGRFGPGMEAKLQSIEAASAEGVERVELLGAAADHKQRLTDRFEPVYEGIGFASTLRGRAAVEALTRGIRLRRLLKRSRTARRIYYRVPKLGRG